MYVSSLSPIILEPLSIIFTIASLHASFLIFSSTSDPIPFIKENKYRHNFGTRLINCIRCVELTIRSENNNYTGNFNIRSGSVKKDHLSFIKQIVTVVYSASAIAVDTIYLTIKTTLFPGNYPLWSLRLDSTGYGTKFVLPANETEKVKVCILKTGNTFPFHSYQVLQAGSITEPSNAGNR